MATDREDTLKKAEKLLRQGRLDAAIAEYLRVVEEQPGDWATANTLGDLYVRAGQQDKAAAQYARIGQHFLDEGFYPKAGAIFKKLLKLNPDDEAIQLSLAEIAQKQGLLADAKAQLNAIAGRRRSRGDKAGAAEIVVRLGSVDPVDFDARSLAARTLAETGEEEAAAERYRALYDDLLEKDREPEALQALREAVRLNPYDQQSRVVLARSAVQAGDFDAARAFLDRETAGSDPSLLTALLDMELRAGRFDEARELMRALLELGPEQRYHLIDTAWATAASHPEAAWVIVETLVDAAAAVADFGDAAALIHEFVTRVPNQIPALLKLVEVCVDGGLEATMYEAQAQLTDAYLGVGQAAEARVIAEDLVAREPWERAHIDRFRRALVMLKVPDPDSLIASRLSGESPFMAKDVFARSETAAPPPVVELPPPPPTPIAIAPIPVAETTPEPPPPPEPLPVSAAPVPVSELSEPAPESPDEIDLNSVLGDFRPAAKPEPIQLSRLPETDESADQAAQHMTLARTYLEMGLPDEAIGSLEVASRTPRFRFEAASLLGRLYRDRGETGQAIEWLERAAEAPAPSEDESRSLLYDLGAMIEENGDTARALAVFLELQSEAGNYRDVAERVERLARVEAGG